MPDWLTSASVDTPHTADVLAVRLLLAVAAGGVIALCYRLGHGREHAEPRTLTATLVLLTALLAMVSLVIGESVARAFGLVGALSIVRFRTIVEDTRDTAFVIFAVIAGMALGTGLFIVAAVGVPIIGLFAVALGRLPRTADAPAPADVVVQIAPNADPAAAIEPLLARHCPGAALRSAATVRQGSMLELTYAAPAVSPRARLQLVRDLNRIDGVHTAEVRAR